MAIDNSFLIKKIESYESVCVLFSAYTHLPFIECDDETFDDQIYMFTTKEMAQTFMHKYVLEKFALQIAILPGKAVRNFLGSLHLLGVNAVIFQDQGAPIRLQLDKLVPKPDLEKMAEAKVPQANPTLQLTGLYFMQELSRPVERNNEEKKHLHDLEEEMAHNLLQAKLILTFDVSNIKGKWNPKDPSQKVKIPLVKTPNGKTYQPVYTEVGELQRFNAKNKGMKLEMMTVPYDKLASFLVKDSEGFVFNPAGFNLILSKEQLAQMQKRYGQEEV